MESWKYMKWFSGNKSADSYRTKEDNRAFYRDMFKIALPVALQNIISYSVNLTDTVMLGKLGEIALSAASLANQVFFVFTAVCTGVSGGAVVLSSQYWGKRDVASIQKVTTIAVKIMALVSALFTALVLFFPRQLMQIYSNELQVIDAGVDYLRVVALSYLFYGLSSVLLIILRSVETVRISVYVSIVSFLLNILFNYIFIFGKWGAPVMGVAGAAVGTLIARFVELVMVLFYLLLRDQKIQYRLSMLRCKSPALFRDLLRYGLPVMIGEFLTALGTTGHSVVLGHLGATVVAANSICLVVFQMATSMIVGLGGASAIYIGKAVGLGDRAFVNSRVAKLERFYLLTGIVFCLVILLIRRPVIAFYPIEEETKAVALQLMVAYAVMAFFRAFTVPMTSGILRGSGDTRFAMITDVCSLWFSCLTGAFAAFVLHLPVIGVFVCLKLDMPLRGIASFIRLRGDRWIKDVTQQNSTT